MTDTANLPPLLPRAAHGGPTSAPFAGLDFSVNTNPFGPNPALLRAARAADYAYYPDPSYLAARKSLARWHGLEPQQVALSTGASDLLHRSVRAFAPQGSQLLSLHAPFGELQRACELGRVQVTVTDEAGLLGNWPHNTRLVYISQPHNPTGRTLEGGSLQQVARLCLQRGAVLLLDLAYAPFLDPQGAAAGRLLPLIPYAPLLPATVSLLSPGKAHGLVGLRPAYAVSEERYIAALENLAPAWHVSASTAAALEALPHAQDHVLATLPQVSTLAQNLAQQLWPFGAVERHGAPYMTLTLSGATQARDLHAYLLSQGLRTRLCGSYGLASSLRISTRLPSENARLLYALGQDEQGRGMLERNE